jgi:adenine-specific DNA-methyltransferase
MPDEVNGPESKVSVSVSEDQLKALLELFPGLLQEGTIDPQVLESSTGVDVASKPASPERFGLNWPTRDLANKALNELSYAALEPVNFDSPEWATGKNVFIAGDNLEALKIMQSSYNNEVDLIYIDPPYNTGNDGFVYNDNFADKKQRYAQVTGQMDEEGNYLRAKQEFLGRKHSGWLSFMYPRLSLARNLLKHDGAIFISIDDNEVHNLRLIMDEIFGPENFVACITWHKTYATRNDAQEFSKSHEYLLVYKRSTWTRRLLPRSERSNAQYKYDDNDGRGLYRTDNLTASRSGGATPVPLVNPITGVEHYPPQGADWRHSASRLQELLSENRIYWGRNGRGAPQLKRYLDEVQGGAVPTTIWHYDEVGHTDKAAKEVKDLLGGGVFDYPKPIDLLRRVITLGSGPGGLVLDFFAGSGTTGHALWLENEANPESAARRFILVNINESVPASSEAATAGYSTISDITIARLREAEKLIAPEAIGGLRIYKIAESVFQEYDLREDEDALFSPTTLKEGIVDSRIVSEIMHRAGISLAAEWTEVKLGFSYGYLAEDKLFVMARQMDKGITEAAITLAPGAIYCLEDAFADNSAIKATFFFDCSKKKIPVKTF